MDIDDDVEDDRPEAEADASRVCMKHVRRAHLIASERANEQSMAACNDGGCRRKG